MTALVLRPLYTNTLTKEKNYKGSLIGPNGPSSLKIIFALLTKVVAVHVELSIVHIRHLSLKRLLMLCWRLSRFLVWLQVGLHKLSKQFIGRRQSGGRSGNWSGNQSKNKAGPGVRLWDGAGEVLSEWGPPTGPGSLVNSSSTGSIGSRFQQGERQRREPLGAIVDHLRLDR